VSRTGGQALVAQLERQGVDTIFCVPGESYLPVLDALHDSPIRLVSARHESAAANMAEAYGKLTGRPGICLVTRGPGSTQAAVGVHTADQGSTPFVLLVGQVPRAFRGREAFQELDYPSTFGGMAKRVVEADDPGRLTEEVAASFVAALDGRPGPVVLALPEDVLAGETYAADAEVGEPLRPQPRGEDLARLRELLAAAERPLAIVGEGGWSADAARDVLAFAEAWELPVAASFRSQDYVDNGSRVYAGHLTIGMDAKLAGRVRDADLIVAIGSRLGDVATRGYTLLEPPKPRQTLARVHPDPAELGRVFEADLPICSDLTAFAAAARELEPAEPRWREWTAAARADYEANLRHEPRPSDLDLGEVMAFLRGRLPDDAILTSGAGNFTVWAHRFYEFRRYGTQLAPQSGAMGYGVPAALAAKLVHPERLVVCLAGDGDFLMAGGELATAVKYDLPVVVLLVNNGMYGTIRLHQERLYPGRVVGTDLVNPDFAAYAESFGAHGETVERTRDVEAAFERAVASGRPALLDLRVDPEAISPRATISQLREESR
jgi:acetolactate synthase-1/2/3 large subunit